MSLWQTRESDKPEISFNYLHKWLNENQQKMAQDTNRSWIQPTNRRRPRILSGHRYNQPTEEGPGYCQVIDTTNQQKMAQDTVRSWIQPTNRRRPRILSGHGYSQPTEEGPGYYQVIDTTNQQKKAQEEGQDTVRSLIQPTNRRGSRILSGNWYSQPTEEDPGYGQVIDTANQQKRALDATLKDTQGGWTNARGNVYIHCVWW